MKNNSRHFPLIISLNSLISDSIKFIKKIERNSLLQIGFSGGKDSIITAKLVELSKRKYKLRYSSTGIDPPEMIKFIKKNYPDCKILHPKMSFWKGLKDSKVAGIPPSIQRRWCCRILKEYDQSVNVIGIRGEESSKRSKYTQISSHLKDRQIFYPILKWPEWAVWDFIEKFNLKYPSLYNENFPRIGCIVCPFHSQKEHQKYRKRWPRVFTKFDKEISKLFYKKISEGKEMFYETPEEYLSNWYKTGGMCKWYRGKEKVEGGLIF